MVAIPTALPDSFTEHTVEADGFTITYAVGGTGETLVYLHGGGGPDLGEAHQLLAAHYQVIAVQMPGFGTSADNTTTTDARAMAATVTAALDTIGIGDFNLLGTSMGTVVALWIAIDHPDRVTHLILEAPAALRTADLDLKTLPDTATLIKAFHAQPQRKPWLDPDAPAPALRDPDLVARIMGPNQNPDLITAMNTLATPTLVLFGTKDGMMPPTYGRLYKQHLPNAVLTFVHDAAHDLKGDRPEAFTDLLTDFINEGSFLINHTTTLINP